MFELLYKKVSETISISTEEFELCKTLFQPKKIRKKRFLLEEGEISKHTIFVEKGLLRSYTVDEKGNEHTLQFASDGWWMGDLYSFFTNEPSMYNIEALEDSELLMITLPSWEELLQKVPAFERYFRIIIQNNLVATQRRLMGNMSETAEEKYLNLLHTYPDIVLRVPQHMIASYLGITRETLSRIRNHLVTKK